MALSPRLQLRQVQRLTLTPSLRQSLSVLQLSNTDLTSLVETEVADNPLLSMESEAKFTQQGDAFQYATDTVAADVSLASHVSSQITLLTSDKILIDIAYYLAASLDDDGYLRENLGEIAQDLDQDIHLVERALNLLHRCEPVGIGARDLGECLALQLRDTDIDPDDIPLLLNNLDDFAVEGWTRLRRRTGRSKAHLKALAERLLTLTPHPAESIGPTRDLALYPEIIVTPDGAGGFTVELAGGSASSLHIDTDMHAQLQGHDAKAKAFLHHCNSRANRLISAIEARSKTLLRLAQAIVALQPRFFAQGLAFLTPMGLADLAESLSLHPSTISRAMAGKSLSCAIGVFPLRFFLTTALPSMAGAGTHSAFVVQQEIARITGAEPAQNPLSDDEIATILRDKGVDIARRTVAKYRQCMKIPSSFQRRKAKRLL